MYICIYVYVYVYIYIDRLDMMQGMISLHCGIFGFFGRL